VLRLSQKWGALSLSKPFNNNSGPKSPLKPGTLCVRPFLVGGECRKSRDNQNTGRATTRARREREKNCNNIVRFYHCETEQNGQTRKEKKRTDGRAGAEKQERNERKKEGSKRKMGGTTGRVLTTTTGERRIIFSWPGQKVVVRHIRFK
jgi:hypothetical protein